MRSPFARLILLALLGGSLAWFLRTPNQEPSSFGPTDSQEESEVGLDPRPALELQSPASADVTALSPALPNSERSAIVGAERTVHIRVHVPEGASLSPDTRVVAFPKAIVRRGNGREALDALDSSAGPAFVWSEAWVDSSGFAELPVSKSIDEPVVLIADRFLYLREGAPIEATTSELTIEPYWGACLVVNLENPGLGEASGSIRLMGFKMAGGQDFSTRTAPADQRLFRGLAGDLTWIVKPDLETLYSPGKMGVELPAGEVREITLALQRGCHLEGTVRDDAGEPMANIEVALTDTQPWMRMLGGAPKTKTDAEGRYHLGPLGPGAQSVEAKAKGRVDAKSAEFELVDGEVRSGVDLVLSLGASIAGRVLDPNGAPLARASVTAQVRQSQGGMGPWGGSRRQEAGSTSTDQDGRFELTGLGEGKYTLQASRRSEGSLGEKATFYGEQTGVAAGTNNVEIRLQAPLILAGRVIDDLGQPVTQFALTGRSVKDGGPSEKQSFSDPAGAFQFERLPKGSWKLSVEAKGYYQPESVAVDLPNVQGKLSLVVQRRASVAGQVLDSAGQPIQGATITAQEPNASAGFRGWGGGPRAESGPDGSFLLADLAPVTWEIQAAAKDWADSTQTTLALNPGTASEGLVLTLRRGGRITGVVSNPDGTPLSGRRVTWGDNPTGFGSRGETRTNSAGRFTFEGVTPGEWQVTATPPMEVLGERMQNARGPAAFTSMMEDLLTTAAVVRESETTEVLLGGDPVKPVRIVGKVERGGTALEGAQVFAVSEGSAVFQGMKTALTDGDGNYELTVDRPGAYVLSTSQGNLGIEALVEVPRSDSYRVDLQIPSGDLVGLVTLPSGEPAPGIRMGLEREDGLGRLRWSGDSTRTDEEGLYRFEGLEPGSYTVRVNAGGMNGAASEDWATQVQSGLRVGKEGETHRNFRLQKPGVLQGIVRGPDGQPVGGATVFFRDASGNQVAPLSSTETDANGRFERKGLAEGAYTLIAKTSELASVESPAVAVQAGAVREARLEVGPATVLVVRLQDREERSARLRVEVFDGEGRDVARLTTLATLRSAFRSGTSSTERRVGPLPPGEYKVRASTADGRMQEQVVRLQGGEPEKSIRLVLEP